MAFSTGSSLTASSEINVTPLIDVLLVLLIIFMVIVPVAPHGLDSSVPQGKSATQAAAPSVTIEVLKGRTPGEVRYRVDRKELAYAEIALVLRSRFAAREDRTLFLAADRGLSFQQVAKVVGEARSAGAGAISLSGL